MTVRIFFSFFFAWGKERNALSRFFINANIIQNKVAMEYFVFFFSVQRKIVYDNLNGDAETKSISSKINIQLCRCSI